MRRFREKYKSILLSLVLAAVMLIVGLSPAASVFAVQTSEKRVVRIPCGFTDLLYRDENGNMTGHCKEYLDELAKWNNWEYEYVEADWPQAMTMLEQGRIDILFPTNMLPEREEKMDYSVLVGGYTAPGLFSLDDSDYTYEGHLGFRGARIAVTHNSSNEKALIEYAEKYHITYTPVYIPSGEKKIEALRDHKVDLVMFSAANIYEGTRLVSVLDPEPFYYTVKKGNTELLEELNIGMQQLLLSDPELVVKTFDLCLTGGNQSVSAFSEAEQDYIIGQKEIRVGFYEQTEPLAYVDSDGDYKGIYVEILQMLKSRLGLNINLYPISRDRDWKDLVRNNEIDFYIGSSDNIIRQSNEFTATDSFREYLTVLITRNDVDMDKEEFTLGLTSARSYWSENMPTNLKNAKVIYYRTARECLLAVRRGAVDGTLLNTIEFNYQTKNPRFSSLVQWENFRFVSGTCMSAKKDVDPALLSLMNKALSTIPEEEISEISSANINMPYKNVDLGDYIFPMRYGLVILGSILLMGVIMAIVIYRIRKKQADVMAATRKKEERQLRTMATLSLEYVVVYYVNLDTDNFDIVAISQELRPEVLEVSKLTTGFFKGMNNYISAFVRPEYQENLKALFDAEKLIARFRDKKDFSARYQVKENKNGLEYFEMHFVDVSRDESEHAMVLGIRSVDEVAKEELEQKKALQEAFDAANRANNAKSDFLSKMSHDIRTPMNAIIGMTAIASSRLDDRERVKDALSKITSSSKHLLGLINEVLDMSKIESGKINLNEEDFNLSELINELLVMIQPQARQHGHDLQVQLVDMNHEDVIGDSLRLQQVLVNILGNAVKYTPDGGIIRLTLREKPVEKRHYGCYEFICEDNGMGMSKEYLEHIFEPFTREEDDRINKIQGTGLGMAISRNIIQMMGGNIQVESEEGEGSTFTITVFLRLQENRDAAGEQFEHLPVLVVDDDQVFCENTCKMLGELGLDAHWCLTGQEAVEKVSLARQEGNDFYALILDWKMPGMDGVETAKELRKIEGDEVPMVILSAYDWSEIEDEAKAAGVGFFLNKPVFKSGLVRLFNSLKDRREGVEEETVLDKMSESTYKGRRILVVEDNEINREIMTENLEMAEIEAVPAENGQIGVEAYVSSNPGYYDMIFMDVQMPVKNGYEAAREIRALDRPDAATIPIIAMTANVFSEDIRAAKEAGMDDHLAKPFDFDKLSLLLNKYLGS